MPLKKVLRQLGVDEMIPEGEELLGWSLAEGEGSSSGGGLFPHGLPALGMGRSSSAFRLPREDAADAVAGALGSERRLRLRRKFPLSNIFSQLGSKVQ